jgi:probable phosphoglycerate mutase
MRTAELAFGPGAARPEPGLREIDVGEWSGRLMEDIRADPRTRPEADLRALYDAPPGGEGLLALERRCRALLDTLDRPTVLVGHGMTGRMLRTLALGCGPEALDDLPSGQGAAFRISHGREEAFWPEPEDASPPPA